MIFLSSVFPFPANCFPDNSLFINSSEIIPKLDSSNFFSSTPPGTIRNAARRVIVMRHGERLDDLFPGWIEKSCLSGVYRAYDLNMVYDENHFFISFYLLFLLCYFTFAFFHAFVSKIIR